MMMSTINAEDWRNPGLELKFVPKFTIFGVLSKKKFEK